MFENERLIKGFTNALENSRVAFIAGSGTASMEVAVMNCFTSDDLVMMIYGGNFGHWFVELCEFHSIPYIEIKMPTNTSYPPLGIVFTQHNSEWRILSIFQHKMRISLKTTLIIRKINKI